MVRPREVRLQLLAAAAAAIFAPSAAALSIDEAAASQEPHLCEFSVPSFFGERDRYRATILRSHFLAEEASEPGEPSLGRRFARIGSKGYAWSDAEDEIGSFTFDFKQLRDAHRKLYGYELPRMANFLIFVEPTEQATCRPTAPFELRVPEREYNDVTTKMVSSLHAGFERAKERIALYSFRPLLPVPLPSGLDKLSGYGHGDGCGIEFSSARGKDHSQLRITFSSTPGDRKSTDCWAVWPARCEMSATTRHLFEIGQGRRHLNEWGRSRVLLGYRGDPRSASMVTLDVRRTGRRIQKSRVRGGGA